MIFISFTEQHILDTFSTLIRRFFIEHRSHPSSALCSLTSLRHKDYHELESTVLEHMLQLELREIGVNQMYSMRRWSLDLGREQVEGQCIPDFPHLMQKMHL